LIRLFLHHFITATRHTLPTIQQIHRGSAKSVPENLTLSTQGLKKPHVCLEQPALETTVSSECEWQLCQSRPCALTHGDRCRAQTMNGRRDAPKFVKHSVRHRWGRMGMVVVRGVVGMYGFVLLLL
jgi:hypothetical protein